VSFAFATGSLEIMLSVPDQSHVKPVSNFVNHNVGKIIQNDIGDIVEIRGIII